LIIGSPSTSHAEPVESYALTIARPNAVRESAPHLAVLWGFATAFFIGNIVALRKYRRI